MPLTFLVGSEFAFRQNPGFPIKPSQFPAGKPCNRLAVTTRPLHSETADTKRHRDRATALRQTPNRVDESPGAISRTPPDLATGQAESTGEQAFACPTRSPEGHLAVSSDYPTKNPQGLLRPATQSLAPFSESTGRPAARTMLSLGLPPWPTLLMYLP